MTPTADNHNRQPRNCDPMGEIVVTPLESLVASGTKLWLDSVDPAEVERNLTWGATGATSNPIIIGGLIETGRFDGLMSKYLAETKDDTELAWLMTDALVKEAQAKFVPAWEKSKGDTGWVSFELDPLLEDKSADHMAIGDKAAQYAMLGKKW